MPQKKAKIYIGTSGWVYPHWDNIFYPSTLEASEKLNYLSKHFNTVEINYSFYRLPKPTDYRRWYQDTPPHFIFAVKVSRFITHLKSLKEVDKPWEKFLANAANLKEKLGPFLFQFPSNFKLTELNYKKLRDFILGQLLSKHSKSLSSLSNNQQSNLRYAFEFRHSSWLSPEVIKLFREHNIALVSADLPDHPKLERVTADFIYLRMHGSQALFSSNYSQREVKLLAKEIEKYQKKGLTVYCYFNNDARGFALANAQMLKDILA